MWFILYRLIRARVYLIIEAFFFFFNITLFMCAELQKKIWTAPKKIVTKTNHHFVTTSKIDNKLTIIRFEVKNDSDLNRKMAHSLLSTLIAYRILKKKQPMNKNKVNVKYPKSNKDAKKRENRKQWTDKSLPNWKRNWTVFFFFFLPGMWSISFWLFLHRFHKNSRFFLLRIIVLSIFRFAYKYYELLNSALVNSWHEILIYFLLLYKL